MNRATLLISLALCAIGAAGILPAPASGGLVTSQLGVQHYPDGTTPIYNWKLRASGAGQAAPFDGSIFGDDRRKKHGLGNIQYSHPFSLSSASIDSASITLGLIDVDSPAGYKPTVRVYFDGVPQPLALFAGLSDRHAASSVSVVTVAVPANLLNDGVLNVRIQAIRHAPHMLGNAIGIDFSRLSIVTQGLDDNGMPVSPPGDHSQGNSGSSDGTDGNSHGGGGDGITPKPPTAIPLPVSLAQAVPLLLMAAAYKRLCRRKRHWRAG